jgi:hypothetical protein
VGYLGNRGLHLYSPLNYNQMPDSDLSQGSTLNGQVANPFYGVIANQASSLSHATVPAYQLLLPHPQFTSVNANYLSNAGFNYNALQVTLEHRFAQGLSLLFNYTHSKMMDNVNGRCGLYVVICLIVDSPSRVSSRAAASGSEFRIFSVLIRTRSISERIVQKSCIRVAQHE